MLFLLSWLFSQQQDTLPTVAIIDFPAIGISQLEADSLTKRFRDIVKNKGVAELMEKEQMIEIVNKDGVQPIGCSSEWCAVELGKLLHVQSVVVGYIKKEKDRHTIRALLVATETGKSENIQELEYVGDVKSLDVEIEVLAYELFDLTVPPDLLEKHQQIVELSLELQGITAVRKRIGATIRSLVFPGLGQIYLDKKFLGFGWMLTELALGGFIYYNYTSYKKSYDESISFLELYRNETDVDLIAEYKSGIQRSYHDAETAIKQRKILTRAAIILWVGSVLHASKPLPKNEVAHKKPSIQLAYDPQSGQAQLKLTIALD